MIQDFVFGSIAAIAIAFAYATILPGIERKIHARIQNRYGPPVTTPGLWNILKFFSKANVKSNSPSPRLYYLFILIGLLEVPFIVLFTNPLWWGVLGFGSVFAIMGLLKVEEVDYLFIGSFSKSMMSLGMPFPDLVKGSKPSESRRYFEEISVTRALKMITLGSFPVYLALFVPFALAGSVAISDVVAMQNPAYRETGVPGSQDAWALISAIRPFAFTLPGIICAFVYFIGYGILSNTRPFDIIKPKIDVMEGPMLEYAAFWRGIYYTFTGLLSFTLSSLFITIFIGIPMSIGQPVFLASHLLLIPVIPMLFAIVRAFSPVFTFKQIYPVSAAASALAFIALALSLVRF